VLDHQLWTKDRLLLKTLAAKVSSLNFTRVSHLLGFLLLIERATHHRHYRSTVSCSLLPKCAEFPLVRDQICFLHQPLNLDCAFKVTLTNWFTDFSPASGPMTDLIFLTGLAEFDLCFESDETNIFSVFVSRLQLGTAQSDRALRCR